MFSRCTDCKLRLLVLGGGPMGLSLTYKLLTQFKDIHVVLWDNRTIEQGQHHPYSRFRPVMIKSKYLKSLPFKSSHIWDLLSV